MRSRTLGEAVVFVFALGIAAGAAAQDPVPTPAPPIEAPTPAVPSAAPTPAAGPPSGALAVDTAQALDNIGKLVKDTGVWLDRAGTREPLPAGFSHF